MREYSQPSVVKSAIIAPLVVPGFTLLYLKLFSVVIVDAPVGDWGALILLLMMAGIIGYSIFCLTVLPVYLLFSSAGKVESRRIIFASACAGFLLVGPLFVHEGFLIDEKTSLNPSLLVCIKTAMASAMMAVLFLLLVKVFEKNKVSNV